MLAAVPSFLLALAIGFFVTAWIAARVRGPAALFVLTAWFVAPYVMLWFALLSANDPTWDAERAAYNQSFAFVLVAILMTVPWLLVFVFGLQRGRNRRRQTGVLPPGPEPVVTTAPMVSPAPTVPPAQPAPPDADDGLPDWSSGDYPRLSLEELEPKLLALAVRGGIDPALLPTFGHIPDGEGEGVFIDKFDYIYLGRERGQQIFEHPTVIADHLCYLVLRDRARALAANRIAATPAELYGERLKAEQQAILATIDPRWGAQFAHEQEAQT